MAKLVTDYSPTPSLSSAEIEEIWQFYRRFVRRERSAFVPAILNTTEIFRVRRDGHLVAFGAVRLLEVSVDGSVHDIIYTCWAMVDPELRGQNLIQRAGVHYFTRRRIRHPLRRIWWLFSASTYTSYLLLPRNGVEYYPHRSRPTSAIAEQLIAETMKVAQLDNWDPEQGVLVANGELRYLEGVVEDEPSVTDDPDVRFYAERNPNQARGDALVCIYPLSARNLASIARRMTARMARRFAAGGSAARRHRSA